LRTKKSYWALLDTQARPNQGNASQLSEVNYQLLDRRTSAFERRSSASERGTRLNELRLSWNFAHTFSRELLRCPQNLSSKRSRKLHRLRNLRIGLGFSKLSSNLTMSYYKPLLADLKAWMATLQEFWAFVTIRIWWSKLVSYHCLPAVMNWLSPQEVGY
jgi:hypothetical protein